MIYYSRVFCVNRSIPSLQEAIDFANSKGEPLKLTIEEDTLDEFSNGGKSFEMVYAFDRQAIQVDINPVDETDPVGEEEIKEFIADIGFAGFSSSKRKVISHLQNTAFIAACAIPGDLDENGQEILQHFLNYFIKECNGLLHVDAEGFYNEDMTILLPE